jgi:hypothetical protein
LKFAGLGWQAVLSRHAPINFKSLFCSVDEATPPAANTGQARPGNIGHIQNLKLVFLDAPKIAVA